MNVSKDEKEPEKVLEVASDAILNFMEQPWENTKELAGNIRDSVVDAVWRSTPQEISEDAGEILGDILTAVATGGGGKAAASGAKIAGNKLLALGKTGVKEFVEGLGDLGKIGAKNAVYVGATTGIENAAKNSFINRLMMMASEAGDEAKKLAGAVEGATSKVDDIATVAGKTGSVANTVTSTTGELIENAVIGTPIVEGIKKIDKTIKNELTEKITREVVGGTTEKTTIQMLEEATDDIVEAGTKVTSKVDDVAEAGANAAGQTTARTVVKENSCANGSGVKISGEKPEPKVDDVNKPNEVKVIEKAKNKPEGEENNNLGKNGEETSNIIGQAEIKEIKNFKEVNIHGKINTELDEVDLVNKIIYEDKSAKKLYMDNPDVPQTESQWAYKQIYKKGANRINALQQSNFTLSGSDNLPNAEELKNIKNYVFRIDADTPELRKAVQQELDNLKSTYPNYNFSAIYGGKK